MKPTIPRTPPTPPTPPTLPAAPAFALPLAPAVRTAYEALYDAYENAIENTTDVGVLEALNASQVDVDNILTKDDEYRLAANTALYTATLQQISSTNADLKALQKQILAISYGVSTFADILAAIDKVLTMVPGV